jgi:hypothetical protein
VRYAAAGRGLVRRLVVKVGARPSLRRNTGSGASGKAALGYARADVRAGEKDEVNPGRRRPPPSFLLSSSSSSPVPPIRVHVRRLRSLHAFLSHFPSVVDALRHVKRLSRPVPPDSCTPRPSRPLDLAHDHTMNDHRIHESLADVVVVNNIAVANSVLEADMRAAAAARADVAERTQTWREAFHVQERAILWSTVLSGACAHVLRTHALDF